MRFFSQRSAAASLVAVALASALGGCVIAPPAPMAVGGDPALAPGRPLPPGYQGDAYAVNDWQARGLSEPPPGYGWRYIDGQYVLVAIATGIIAASFLGLLLGGPGGGPGGGWHGPGPR